MINLQPLKWDIIVSIFCYVLYSMYSYLSFGVEQNYTESHLLTSHSLTVQ